jgi:transposase InsO family protein
VTVYPFIEAEKAQRHNVTRACELLEVSRSAYYAHRAGPSQRARQDAELSERIGQVPEGSAGTYGAPRVHAELRAQGRRHSRKRIARLMRAAGLHGRAPRRWRTTTIPDPAAATGADGDITYINTWQGVAVPVHRHRRSVLNVDGCGFWYWERLATSVGRS